ncbi:terminase small subunit [Gordonia phage Jamzy]|nr:terminase small subunit [Gordonia phage Jamzy]
MAGRGAAPKDPSAMANASRAKAEKAKIRTVESEPCDAPELPDLMPDGTLWPEHTKLWWEHWTADPLTADYRMGDWLDLLDCAAIHGRLWQGDFKAASELRLRMARHGATREDRARLRIVFAQADQADTKASQAKARGSQSARERRAGMKAV